MSEAHNDDFRRVIMHDIGALAIEGRTFDYRTNERIQKALETKLLDDRKDQIVDREAQKKIDVVKERAIRTFGSPTCRTSWHPVSRAAT